MSNMINKSEKSSSPVPRALDLMRASEYTVTVTDFLTPGEQCDIYKELCVPTLTPAGCFFWGGCRGAERCAAVFLPEWYLPADAPNHTMPADRERTEFFSSYLKEHPEITAGIPITALKITGSGFKELSHRDYMGSILSLGINRSVLGDIAVVSESEAIVFVADRIAEYIVTSLTKIGRDGVKVERTSIDPEWTVPRRYADVPIVVSSPRLDGVVKAITGQSRETCAEMVRAGLVELSYSVTDNVSAEVRADDIVSVRGYGKYLVGKVTGETKSGRLKIECKKYL